MYNGNYQRNGICGEGFFSCFIDWKDGKEGGKGFLATFGEHTKNKINTTNCRIVDLDNPKCSWRGDNFGADIEDFLKSQTDDFYKFITEC